MERLPAIQRTVWDDDLELSNEALRTLSRNRSIRGSLSFMNKVQPGNFCKDSCDLYSTSLEERSSSPAMLSLARVKVINNPPAKGRSGCNILVREYRYRLIDGLLRECAFFQLHFFLGG